MTEVEETLRRTFGQAAGQAPRLPALLPERLERIHRRRRRRTRVALAAAAVVLVAGGAVAVVPGGDVMTTTTASEARAATPAEHVEKVWPEAVRKVPAKGPDGASWRPETFIDDRTLLVTAPAGFDQPTAVYAYDLDGDSRRKIADLPSPESPAGAANGFAVGDGHVVWWTSTKDRVAHLWAVPVDGGTAKIVADQSIKEGTAAGSTISPWPTARLFSRSTRAGSSPSPWRAARWNRSREAPGCICCPGRGSARRGEEASPKAPCSPES
ncbi:hypothetical protein ACFQX6_40505 [Streptosporangium lutulentum]